MITLISFLLVLIGSINWLCIGLLQYDFVAGLFGSQANVFSRIVYAIIGLASLVLVYAAIKTKGCIKCNGKKSSDQELRLVKKKDKNNDNVNNSQQVDNKTQQNEQQNTVLPPTTNIQNEQQTTPQNEQDSSQTSQNNPPQNNTQ